MIILDSQNKSLWKNKKTSISSGFTISQGGFIESSFNSGGKVKLRIFHKNKSGNGYFEIKIADKKNKIFFKKDLKSPNGLFSEDIFILDVQDDKLPCKIFIDRSRKSFGRIEVGRLTIESIEKKKLLKKDISKKPFSSDFGEKSEDKCAIIIPYHIYGGAEVYIQNLLESVSAEKNINLLSFSDNKLLKKLNNYSSFLFENKTKLLHHLVQENYKSIIYYNSKNIYSFLTENKLKNRFNSDLIEIYHSNFEWSDSVSSIKSRKSVSKIIRISDSFCNDISGDFDIKTIPVSINLDKFSRKNPVVKKGHIGFSEEKPLFGLVARLSQEKNIEYAISLFSKIKNSNLAIFGSGPLKASLESILSKNKYSNIKIINHKENINDYYNIFDAFILTSKIEGTPFSIAEAMAFELPVFSTDVGDIKNTFSKNNEISFLSGNIKEDTNLIRSFLKNIHLKPGSRNAIGKLHDAKINGNIFLNYILDKNLEFKEELEDMSVLPGELI